MRAEGARGEQDSRDSGREEPESSRPLSLQPFTRCSDCGRSPIRGRSPGSDPRALRTRARRPFVCMTTTARAPRRVMPPDAAARRPAGPRTTNYMPLRTHAYDNMIERTRLRQNRLAWHRAAWAISAFACPAMISCCMCRREPLAGSLAAP